MAYENLPDLDALSTELVQLRHRRAEAVRLYEKALERVALFPNEVERARAADLAGRIEEMNAKVEWLEAQLLPILRRDDASSD
jgi:hypothetical protein